MKKTVSRILASLMTACLLAGVFAPAVYADETTEDPVAAVTAQLEAIDTLQEMQDARSSYTVKNNHYDSGTTNSAVADEHNAVRAEYEKYVATMFAARAAAQQAYDALTAAQQAQIDPALVAKLNNELSTEFLSFTATVTPGDDEYTFEAVKGGAGQAYEVGNHMVSGQIPQTFILVDTSDGKTSWTPSGLYEYGVSNYDVAYCCDAVTRLAAGTDYKRVNLEDSGYYGPSAASHIRAILLNSYPFVTMEQMKANLIAGGLGADFVNTLTRADMISAVQMAIWTYANAADGAAGGLNYFATVNVPKNNGIYFTPLHDYTNETWEWQPGKRQRTYDARAAYRVNNLAYYLCNLPGVDAPEDGIVITDVDVTRADLIPGSDDMYTVGMYVTLNKSGSAGDNLRVKVTSCSADGNETAHSDQPVSGSNTLEISVNAKSGDTIKVVVEGTQTLPRGVYFYEPKGGRDASQSLVGVGEGVTKVRAEEEFVFVEDVGETGLRIYKTETGTGAPLSDIVFHIYSVDEGTAGEVPTAEEIAKYAVADNLKGTITTDSTGYGAVGLDEGTYLVVEEHNAEKVVAPIDPFYITIPMYETRESEDGTTTTEAVKIISVYPKNETVTPPEEPPITPPTPDNVSGKFAIRKHDANDSTLMLEGAQFKIYRPATESDTDTIIVTSGGIDYAVVDTGYTLTTDINGYACSEVLECGTYFLVETKAPAGYNLLDEAVIVTVSSSEMTSINTVQIANQRGNILPETGAEGTRMLITIGSIITVSAAVLLITKKRMSIYE